MPKGKCDILSVSQRKVSGRREGLFRMNNVIITHGKQVENYCQKQCADELCDINGYASKVNHRLAKHFGEKHKYMPNNTYMLD